MGSLALLESEGNSSPQVQATQEIDGFATDDQVTTGKKRHKMSRKIRRQIDVCYTDWKMLLFIRGMQSITFPPKPKTKRRYQDRSPSTHRPVGYSKIHRNSEAWKLRLQQRHALKPCTGMSLLVLEDELADFAI